MREVMAKVWGGREKLKIVKDINKSKPSASTSPDHATTFYDQREQLIQQIVQGDKKSILKEVRDKKEGSLKEKSKDKFQTRHLQSKSMISIDSQIHKDLPQLQPLNLAQSFSKTLLDASCPHF